MTLELTDLETKALRSALQWVDMMIERKQIDVYDYQLEAFDKIAKELNA